MSTTTGPTPSTAKPSEDRLVSIVPPGFRSNLSAALDAIESGADSADDDDELWREAARDFDAQRPHRPLLKGQY